MLGRDEDHPGRHTARPLQDHPRHGVLGRAKDRLRLRSEAGHHGHPRREVHQEF